MKNRTQLPHSIDRLDAAGEVEQLAGVEDFELAPNMDAGTAWSIERDRQLRHLWRANRYIAEVMKRIERQRALIAATEKGRPSIEEESLLSAMEASRRALEKHRQFVVDLLENAGWLPRE